MNWLDIVQSVGIVISIMLVIWQVRLQTKQMKATANAIIAAKVDEINRLMFENPDIFPKLDQPYPGNNLPNDGDRRYHLMHIFLNTFELVFIDYRRHKFIEKSGWDSWTRIIMVILHKPYAHGHWEATKDQYTEEFQEFMNNLIAEQVRAVKILPQESPDNVENHSEVNAGEVEQEVDDVLGQT